MTKRVGVTQPVAVPKNEECRIKSDRVLRHLFASPLGHPPSFKHVALDPTDRRCDPWNTLAPASASVLHCPQCFRMCLVCKKALPATENIRSAYLVCRKPPNDTQCQSYKRQSRKYIGEKCVVWFPCPWHGSGVFGMVPECLLWFACVCMVPEWLVRFPCV